MKKIILIIALIAGISSYAESLFDKTKRECEEIYSSSTSEEMKSKIKANEELLLNLHKYNFLKDLRLKYDKKFGEKGAGAFWAHVSSFPIMSENSRRVFGLDVSMSNSVEIVKKYNVDLTPYGVLNGAKLTPNEIITVFNDFVRNTYHVETEWLTVLKQYFYRHGTDIAEEYLKSEEKYTEGAEELSFEIYLDAISSPYYSDMNRWLESVGVTNKITDISKIWTAEGITTLKTKILNGDWALTESNKIKLQMCLGLDEYNKFIDDYVNGVTVETRSIPDKKYSRAVQRDRKIAREYKARHTESDKSKKELKMTRWDLLYPKAFSDEEIIQKRAKKLELEDKDTKELWKSNKIKMRNRRVNFKLKQIKIQQEKLEKEKLEKDQLLLLK